MGFFKDLIGGFAEGYIEERGAQGTLEDLGKLASNVKGWFSDNEDKNSESEGAWEEMWERVGNLIDEEEFDEAENTVIDYYNKYENGVADLAYYYLRARISLAYYQYLNYDSEQLTEIEDEINEFIKAFWKFNLDNDQKQNIKELKKEFEEVKKEKRESQVYVERWNKLKEEISSLLSSKRFNDATIKLDSYYSTYEDEYDYWYYEQLFDIILCEYVNIEFHKDLDNGILNGEKLLKRMSDSLEGMKKLGDEDKQDLISTNNDLLDGFKLILKYKKCDSLINKKKYKEAKEFIFLTFPTKGRDYYKLISRLESRKLEDLVLSSETKEIIEKCMEEAIFNMNMAVELEENAEGRTSIKEDVCPSIEKAKQYLSKINNSSKISKNDENSNESQDAEQEYLIEYRACLENDGVISDREKRLLDRLRISLGISEVRARELEEMCIGGMTPEEQEYAEEIRACLADDGLISDRERRILDRLAKSLNISSERAKEIELTIKK